MFNGTLDLAGLIITFNEAPNIARTIESLQWLSQIIVVDSGSTDKTLEILSGFPSVKIVRHPFEGFAEQCNFGLSKVDCTWVLSLDADYQITHSLAKTIRTLFCPCPPPEEVCGYSIPFKYCIYGQPLRTTLLPRRTILHRVEGAHYRNDGHGHRVVLKGLVRTLEDPVLHDDRKPITRWLASQQNYMLQEAHHLLTTPSTELSAADRLRKHTPLAPIAVAALYLLIKGGWRDGRHGLHYALERTYAELLLLLVLTDHRIRQTK